MRMIFVGGSELAIHSAVEMIERGHEVVIIEKDQNVIDDLSQEIDCGFIRGDGTKPRVLEEASPDNTDALICLSDSDTDNILCAQVAHTLGFDKVVLRVGNDELEPVCRSLKLDNVIYTNKQLAREVINYCESIDGMRMSAHLTDDLQFVELTLTKRCPESMDDVELPDTANLVCMKREGRYCLPAEITSLKGGDELLFVTTRDHLSDLRERLHLSDSQ